MGCKLGSRCQHKGQETTAKASSDPVQKTVPETWDFAYVSPEQHQALQNIISSYQPQQ